LAGLLRFRSSLPWRDFLDDARTRVTNCYDRRFNSAASAFYKNLVDNGYAPDTHIDVLPRHGIIYLCIPKCASTTIRMTLSGLAGRAPAPDEIHKRRCSGLSSPRSTGLARFHRLALSPASLRFSFVRNPYARLVSAWANKFRSKPLVPGDAFVNVYLKHRRSIDSAFPEGPDCALSFSQFAKFANATAERRLDAHWQLQDDLLSMPGIKLDLVGKVEAFEKDFAPVLNHVGTSDQCGTPAKSTFIHPNISLGIPIIQTILPTKCTAPTSAISTGFATYAAPDKGCGNIALQTKVGHDYGQLNFQKITSL
jgi:Sulfotransferase family